jgi:ferric-dicitrate binding protein FerR (iron transport regulator)
MTDTDRIDLLIQGYFEDRLSPAEVGELDTLLRQDKSRVVEFVRQLEIHAGLWETMAQETAAVEPGREVISSRRTSGGRRIAVRLLVPLAACLTIVCGLLAHRFYQSWRFAESIVARIEAADSGVSIRRGDRTLPGTAGAPLAAGDRIETAAGQRVSFVYVDDETRVSLGKNTAALFEKSTGGKRLFLHRGTLDADVAPQPENMPMVIGTPHAELAVLGTVFSVTAKEDQTGLEVREGTVRIGVGGGAHHEDVQEGGLAFARAGLDRVLVPGRLVMSMRITGLPPDATVTGIAIEGKNLWVHGYHGPDQAPVLACLDPATGRVVREVNPVEPFISDSCITWKDGLLWGFSRDGTSLCGVDVETGEVERTVPLPVTETSSQRVFDIWGNAGWLRGRLRKELIEIDLRDGAVLKRITCPFAIDRIAVSATSVYIGERGWNACRIDPGDGRIAYRFMCEAESVTGDMAIARNSRLWTVQGTKPVIHVFDAE